MPRHIAGRDRQVRVAQWNTLWPASAAAGVQDQRDVVWIRWRDRLSIGDAAQRHSPRGVHLYGQDGNVAGCRARRVKAFGRKQQHFRVGVLEVETELLLLVRRVEWGRRS